MSFFFSFGLVSFNPKSFSEFGGWPRIYKFYQLRVSPYSEKLWPWTWIEKTYCRSKFFTIWTTKLANNIYILGHPPNSEQDLGSKLTNKRQRFLCTLHLHTFVGFPIKFWWRTVVCILQCFFKVALILRGCTAKANSSKTKVLHNILKVRIQAYVLRTSEGRSWICWGILLPVKNMATSEEKLLQLCSNRW